MILRRTSAARTLGVRLAVALACIALLAGPSPAAPDDPTEAGPRIRRVDLRDVPLLAACRILSDQTGLNLVPSSAAGGQRVSLFLTDVPAMTAVEALCEAHQLWFRRDPRTGILRIHTEGEYKRDLLAVKDEVTEVFTLLYPNAVDVGYAIRNLYGDRVVLRLGSGDQELVEDLENRLDRFDLIDERTQGFGVGADGQFGNGTAGTGSYVGADGTVTSSSGQGRTQRYQRYRAGTDTTRDEGDSRTAATAARERARLDVSAGEITALERLLAAGAGPDAERDALVNALARRAQAPIRVSVLRRQNRVVVRTSDAAAMEQLRTLVRRLDVPTSMVLLEVRVLSIEIGDGFSSFFEYQFSSGDSAGGFTEGNIRPPPGPGLALGGTGLRAGDLTFQFVNDSFAARLQVLETKNRVSVVATPLLLTANNEVSRLFVGREVPLNRSFVAGQTIVNDTSTTTVPGSTNIEFRPVGTTLLITPTINADRTVTLRIVQENSDVNSKSTVLVPTSTGFEPQDLNVVSSQTVSGTIVAKSELAVAFGGLVETIERREREQVPILGDVPVLGYLFRRQVDVSSRREIVIVVRPFVMSTPAESESISRQLLKRLCADTCAADLEPGCGCSTGECEPRGGKLPFRLHGCPPRGAR